MSWVQPGIATPPLRHSINQSERKNAGVGSATCCHFWQSGEAFATPFHSHILPHSITFTTVSCVNPFIPTNKYASQSQGKACFLFLCRRRPSAHFLRFSPISPMAIAIGVFCIWCAGGIVVDLACENCHHRVKNHCTSGGTKENLNRKEESNRKDDDLCEKKARRMALLNGDSLKAMGYCGYLQWCRVINI